MLHGRTWSRWRSAIRLPVAVGVALLAAACAGQSDSAPLRVAGGDASRGQQLIRDYGCHSCHMVPGVRGADALVGPPLIHWSSRVYIAGLLPNTPENLVAWIYNPQQVHPETAMPNMGVTPTDARHIAAYLYTLR